MNGLKIRTEACKTLAFGSIVAGYTAVGTPVGEASQIVHIQNHTDAMLWFSYDGVIDHFPLAAGSFLVLDITTNKDNAQGYFLQKGTSLYVKRLGIPTSGSVYFTSYYSR